MQIHIFYIKHILMTSILIMMFKFSAAQVPLLNKDEWFRPDFAKASVDTSVIDSFQKHNFNKPLTIIKKYNHLGYIDYYEKEYVQPTVGPELQKYSVNNKFEYDAKNRLSKIYIGLSLQPKDYPIILPILYQSSFLNKNGGAIPDYYGKYFLSNLKNVYSGLVVKINYINFFYNASGKPTKHSINFTIYGIAPIYGCGNQFESEAHNLTIKEINQESETLTISGHNLDYISKLGLITFK